MQIAIAARLKPFCHLPGTSTVLPGTYFAVQVFPCLIRFFDLKKTVPFLISEFSLDLKGPVEQFTIFNDLERAKITVSGKSQEGWFRYHIIASQSQEDVRLYAESTPPHGIVIGERGQQICLQNKEWMDLLKQNEQFILYQIPQMDRLALGIHKAQDLELMRRRMLLAEIFPIWHRLGQLVPLPPIIKLSEGSSVFKEGTLALLEACRRAFDEDTTEEAEQKWLNAFQVGFDSLFEPQLEDLRFQGLIPIHPLTSLDISPLIFLAEGSSLIRNLFIQQKKGSVTILPFLLPSLHSGRLIDVPLLFGGKISFEWSKKIIRRVILTPEQDQELLLQFRHVRRYRLRQHGEKKGERHKALQSLSLKKNCQYFLDNFE